jgi:hypothetical protein
MDRKCWNMALQGYPVGDGTNPIVSAHSHTVMCISMLECVASGFYIVVNSERKQADDEKKYVFNILAYISQKNTSTVSTFLKTLTRPAQIYIKATGNKDLSGDIVLSNLIDAYDSRLVPSAASRFSTNSIFFIMMVTVAVCYRQTSR